jgi:hypothetical protein
MRADELTHAAIMSRSPLRRQWQTDQLVHGSVGTTVTVDWKTG